jgi:UTP-glucose-1-phosphate uridylyltransferase/mevalonate kinase
MTETKKSFTLFVPGRICLFGEHSDWAGGHRRINSKLGKGYTIITGTNQGLYATVKSHPTHLIFRTVLADGTSDQTSLPMRQDDLLACAQKGGFFSYVAGVTYQIMTHYHVGGIEIDNFRTDLPVKKGLSSSAAVCVMVARAFNRLYDLKMTVRGEMDFAYRGEITTPSRCGRMDQGCAYGVKPILMTFDGDSLDVEELHVGSDLFFVIADLRGGKDTVRILRDLNKAFPFADGPAQESVQEYLGRINVGIVARAVEAIREGSAEKIGGLMSEAQREFDAHLGPVCPSELAAPILHGVLNDATLRPYVYGGKGVGSQGDGSVQFIARDAASQEALCEALRGGFSMPALPLTIGKTKKIRKAVITAAGFGTRLFPMTKIIRKELMPVFDADGNVKPLILANIEEAIDAGIEEICIIIQEKERRLFESFFHEPLSGEIFNRLSSESQEQGRRLEAIGEALTLIAQSEQKGLGHALYEAREWTAGEPFLFILGDHFFLSSSEIPCARQLVNEYENTEEITIGLVPTPISESFRFGCVSGTWETPGRVLAITQCKEKPDPDFARQYLVTESTADTVLTVFGLYVLTPAIFEHIGRLIGENRYERGEIQLTTALEELRRTTPVKGLIIDGEKIDIGVPSGYRKIMAAGISG